MDEDLAALEQFCLLAKSARGRAVVGIISQTLASKRVFVFGELLAMASVQALRETDHAPHLRLLELFAYGTCSDYRAAADSLPALNAPQIAKLRLLSVISLAKRSNVLPYAALHAELAVETLRDVEDVIIEAMYAGLVSGKMNQEGKVFHVTSTAGRDVRVCDVVALVAKLQAWANTAVELSAALEKNKLAAKEKRAKEAARTAALQAKIDQVKKHLKENTQAADAPFEVDNDRPKRRGKRTRLPPFSRGSTGRD
ncbi:hypothetical protein M885DRAFT_533875 [Pelagophyceae sp. CCMP2097]|nr:hypothetical protein M885DRAFT_533875 [Pelagophyceae sp. CCMP2097]|mmetsp:Transcript_12218/g.40761  ORF Transcript_12218/g.40761 Transcript_12218/m.40761 type:complete len:255 (-) Transcript_12218:190-954(-)